MENNILKLEDITLKITDGAHHSPKDYKNGLPMLSVKHMRENGFDLSNCKKISEEDYEKLVKSGCQPIINDILIAKDGSVLKHIFRVKDEPSYVLLSSIAIVRPNLEIVDPEFLSYSIKNPITKDLILNNYLGGTGVPRIVLKDFKKIDFDIPPLPEQKAIASVLSSLDDKIDLLQQQNQTLEALAETLYLNFISDREFDSKLTDIFSLQNGYAFKSKSFREAGIIRVIKIKNISGDIVDINNSDFVEDEAIEKLDSKFKIKSGDILIAMTGAEVGKLGIVPETDQNLWLNQRVGCIKEKFQGAKYLAYLHLKSDFGQDYIENTATGSAQPNISGEGIENCDFPKFDTSEIIEISSKLSPLYDKVIFNLGQIQTLTNLRDTLLPKLMSGEVRVKL